MPKPAKRALTVGLDPLVAWQGYSPKMGPPVAVVQLQANEGKFAFVEFRDELMAVTALQLDKKVELAGRPLNVGLAAAEEHRAVGRRAGGRGGGQRGRGGTCWVKL